MLGFGAFLGLREDGEGLDAAGSLPPGEAPNPPTPFPRPGEDRAAKLVEAVVRELVA